MNLDGKGQSIAAMNKSIRKTSKYNSPPFKSKKSYNIQKFCEICLDYKKLAMRSVPNSSAF